MASPEEMGRYVDWLVAMVQFHVRKGQAPKALKRAASLSRVAFQTDITDRISNLARQTTVYIDQKLNDLKNLKTTLTPLAEARSKTLLKSISQQERELETERKQRATNGAVPPAAFEARAKKIAFDLLRRIDKRAAQSIA